MVRQGHKDGRNKTSLGSIAKLVTVSAAIRCMSWVLVVSRQERERNVVYVC